MIEIKQNINIPKIAELFVELREKEEREERIDLLLPKQIKNKDFGVLFSLLQFVASWVRSPYSNSLCLPVSEENELSEYLFKEFAYPSIVLSWEKQIIDLNKMNVRPKLKEPSKSFFQQMEFFELPEKESVPIFCFDHDVSKRGLSKNFYESDNKVLSESAFDYTLFPAFQKIANHFNKKVFTDSIKGVLIPLYGIIHELFNNTHEHAKTSEKGHNLYPNLRALYLKFHKRNIESYKDLYKEHPGLLEYFNSEFDLNSKNELYLFEVSVLDSGPGLVKRYANTSNLNMTMRKEVEFIKHCLFRHNTSAKGLMKETKGLGLDRVLQTIDGKGFVRIKSGRADIFRNMKKWRYKEHNDPSEIILYDWKENTSDQFSQNPEATGTLISIIYPLDYK